MNSTVIFVKKSPKSLFATSIHLLHLFQIGFPGIFCAGSAPVGSGTCLNTSSGWVVPSVPVAGAQEGMSVSHWARWHCSFPGPDCVDSAGNTPRQMELCFHGSKLLPTDICATLWNAGGKVSQCGHSKQLEVPEGIFMVTFCGARAA